MPEIQHPKQRVERVCFRSLIAACLTLSIAILWAEARRQSIQDIMHGTPLGLAIMCGFTLLIFSLFYFRRFGRLAVYGLAVSIWTLFVCLLPTV